MISVWIHIENENYWEGQAVLVSLPAMPRRDETIFLSEDTLIEMTAKGLLHGKPDTDGYLTFKDAMTVTDVCYIENSTTPHVMVRIP